MILNVENLSHGFGDRAIFNNVSFRLLKGEHIGLIGANGEGKSTFMNIVTGKLMPDEGKVEWAKNIRVGYLDQHTVLEPGMTIGDVLRSAFSYLYEMEERMTAIFEAMADADAEQMEAMMEESGTIQDLLTNHDFYVIDAKVDEIARAFGLAEIGLDRDVTELSGGQRTKVLLAKLLLEKPDILLLDEPTNHLDLTSIKWLETYLSNYNGAVLIIAHDRYFLDKIVTKVIEIENTHCHVYDGNYSDFSVKKKQLRQAQLNLYLKQQSEIKHQEEVIAKLRSYKQEKFYKRAESREKALANMERIDKPEELKDVMNIKLEPDCISGNDVLTVEGLSKSFDNLHLFSDISFEIKRGEHVALIGDNGTGKTTILKIINDIISADAGTVKLGTNVHIGYYDQEHHNLEDSNTLFEEIADAYPDMTNTKIRNTLAAFMFTGDDVFKLVKDLSGGEKGRLSLAKLMLSEANLIILDEPTNHLDMTSKEILENAINNYTGTVFYVSHDRYFINQTASRILELTNTKIINYLGNYDYYEEKCEELTKTYAPAIEKEKKVTSTSSGKQDYLERKAEAARTRKLKNDISKVEKEIKEKEDRLNELDELLADPAVSTNSAKLNEISKEQNEISERLDELMDQWEILSDQLD